jgi:23S rRNA pseudouridine2457 synthase
MHRHFIIHKPFGYLSQFINNQNKRRNKKLLGDLYDFPDDVMSIGRLDENSEGLLLLTTDGKESERVRSKKVEKEYYVQLDGIISEEALIKMQKGVEIGIRGQKYLTLPCKTHRLDPEPNFATGSKRIRGERHGPTTWASITITEGKYRQVRKMTAAVGFPTLRLMRVRIGDIKLGEMIAGEVIEVDVLNI